MSSFSLKASSDDNSQSIILSFHARWVEPLREQKCTAVFRKRGPTKLTPTMIYVYAARPISAIVARMPVLEYQYVDTEVALKMANKGAISREELASYANRWDQLLIYTIGKVEFASEPVSRTTLSSDYGFAPSQTYIPLSHDGKSILDHLAGFDTSST